MHNYPICLTWIGDFCPLNLQRKNAGQIVTQYSQKKNPNRSVFHVKRKKLLWNTLKDYVVSEPEILIFWSCLTYTASFLLFFFPFLNLQKQSKTNQRNKQTTHFLVKQNKGEMFHLGKGGYRYQGHGTAKACLRQWQSFFPSDSFGTFHRSAANWW